MDEGKPTRPKWWNRPGPRGISGPGEGAAPRTGPTEAEGDFLLGPPEDRASRADADGSAATDDFELEPPGPRQPGAPLGDGQVPRDRAPAEPAVFAAPAPAEPAPGRPEPSQDYDSSSTPPYGVPGPWAPAPPVQHPATTTSAHGRGVPTPPPVAPISAPPSHGLPGPEGPEVFGGPEVPEVPEVLEVLEGRGTAIPAPPMPHGSPAPAPQAGHDTPTSSPSPVAPVPLGDTPAPAPASVPAQAPHLDAPVPPPPGHPPASAPAASVAPAAPLSSDTPPLEGQPSDSVQDTASHLDAPVPFPATATAPPADQPPASAPGQATPNPWRNYDPWAPVPGPLQQTGAAVDTEGARRRRARRVLLVGALLLALVAGGIGGVVGAYLERNGVGGDVVELPQAEEEPAGRAPGTVAGIAARSLPSVVTLHVSGAKESGTGTGFVLDERGHILTNNHVVEPAGADGEISVTFQSGDTAEARVVGRDSGYDLAVVEVSGVGGLRPIPLGNSDSVQVGDPVVAIGAPFDLEGTVTSGIISAKERPITAGGESGEGSDVSYVDALQTDAPINPGNSGGPLLDSRARVIGINSAIRSADDGTGSGTGQAGSIGLGFAIPVNQAKRVAEELINTGRATHPVIGVTLDMDYTGDGARIGTKGSDGGPAVTEGGPGDRAGLRAGDVVTEVDGRRVHSGDELIVRTRAHRPGDRLQLTVKRDGRERSLSLVLESSDGG
ncbi:S1C family serine protease [Streptomyces sviceus]|uniref:S1C family serine protease n=1 Tax=Streptomyces sviceus TaxID=285530 RepID=UPI00368C681D